MVASWCTIIDNDVELWRLQELQQVPYGLQSVPVRKRRRSHPIQFFVAQNNPFPGVLPNKGRREIQLGAACVVIDLTLPDKVGYQIPKGTGMFGKG